MTYFSCFDIVVGAVLDFAETVYRVSEEDGYFEICVDLAGELERGIQASIDIVLTTAG